MADHKNFRSLVTRSSLQLDRQIDALFRKTGCDFDEVIEFIENGGVDSSLSTKPSRAYDNKAAEFGAAYISTNAPILKSKLTKDVTSIETFSNIITILCNAVRPDKRGQDEEKDTWFFFLKGIHSYMMDEVMYYKYTKRICWCENTNSIIQDIKKDYDVDFADLFEKIDDKGYTHEDDLMLVIEPWIEENKDGLHQYAEEWSEFNHSNLYLKFEQQERVYNMASPSGFNIPALIDDDIIQSCKFAMKIIRLIETRTIIL